MPIGCSSFAALSPNEVVVEMESGELVRVESGELVRVERRKYPSMAV